MAVIGPEISDDEPNPKPIVQEIYANWEAPAQTASGSFDFDYGIITNKVQLKTTEKVDGATIEIEPITKSGTIDGGTWNISPADKQSVTTAGHTNDDNFQNNGGAASASWTLHYSVSKTTDSRNGRVGPYTTQDEADAAADSARDAAISELQGEAQRMVDNAVASAKAELANVKFRYEEVGVPYGFEMYWGSNGSNQTISVPANSNNAYLMKNDEWSLQVNIKKTDSETGNQIAADAQYEIFQWDTVTGKYQPTGGYNTYSVQRQGNGTYAVINSAAYATTDSMRHTLYYTQRNAGKFIIVESKAPTGYFGDWTDINHPGIVNTPLGKRGYYIEITEDSDNSVIWLDNADYNADIAATDKGGTKLVTSTGVETTVTIYDTGKDSSRTFNTDNSGKAANEDSYTITPSDGVMKNDRTLGEISISKVDLDAVRYVGGSTTHGTALASGQAHGDATLDGAVYDLYAAEDITHPDGVTGVVDYSKIVDADGNPIWHTTIRDNSGQWVSDYLPVLKKDHLVASAKIENGWLCFSNLYLGKYYVVERSTGVVIPLRDGALAVSGTYPTVDSRTKAVTGQTAALAKNGSGQYTDWVYKNQFSTVSKGKALDGSWTYDAYYMGYTVKYGPRVEHMAVRHKDAQRNIRIDRLDPRFSETALREYYRQLHRMPTEMQQEYRQENAPAKPKWQPTELQPTVRRARYLGKLPRRYPKVSGFMACYYHYCALLRKAYHGKATKRCYFLLREDFLLFSRYQQQTKFLWENHIETMDELLAYKENAEVQIQQLARQRKVLYRQKREPERAAREEKIKSLTQQMKALRHEVYICSDIETDAAEVQEKLRQAELAAQEERNEVKQDEQRRRSSRSDGAGSLTGCRSSH